MSPSIELGYEDNEVQPRSASSEPSEYGSMPSSVVLPEVLFTATHLKFLNKQLANLEPQDILRWCLLTLPRLHQTTALGLTGLATTDMLSRMSPGKHPVPLIFVDTLYHFPETLQLLDVVRRRYPSAEFHVYRPEDTPTVTSFNDKYGPELWKRDEKMYDYLVKVEPARRAYHELGVVAVLTGRRKSQGGARGNIDIIEIDETGLIKVNPLANWSFKQVESYIREFKVPYNELLDHGYRSVGDWHSTVPVKEGEDERAGRWKGSEKSECGLHEDYFALRIKAKLEAARLATEGQTQKEESV
jgi:phosphoadenosine phosphosulfate reductase